MNGKTFSNFKAIFYGRNPVNVKDNLAGEGCFSFQNNVLNPESPMKWQQNTLEVGFPRTWGVLVGTLLSQEKMFDAVDLPVTEFYSVTLEIDKNIMSVVIQDIIANKVIYQNTWDSMNEFPILAAEAVIVGQGNSSVAFFTPDKNPNISDNFYVQVSSKDGPLSVNILDSDASYEENLAAITIGNVKLTDGPLTAESSNLSAEIVSPNTVELKVV